MAEVIFGIHAVEAKLRKHSDDVFEILISRQRQDQRTRSIEQLAQDAGITITRSTTDELDQLSESANHQGVVARCHARQMKYDEDYLFSLIRDGSTPPFFLVLDGIQDPHNLGACLRTADGAGVQAVIAPKDRSVALTPTVRKVACGAAENVPFITVTNLARTLKALKDEGVWLVATSAETDQTIYDVDLTGSIAIIVGAEGTGVRRLTQDTSDYLVRIPMNGSVESLNASVATAICLYEVVRQRLPKRK